MNIIARVHSDFSEKFGIPRQSGLIDALQATVVFEPPYRDANALRGLEDYSHIWLIWQFSESVGAGWSPTVKPPRLGGNRRMGVFATRSPFRPNPLGLSCVRLTGIEFSTSDGPVLRIAGADLLDGTPVYDIKPYIPFTDCRPEATGGFTAQTYSHALTVDFPPDLLNRLPPDKREAILRVLEQDPRPGYRQDTGQRLYGVSFAGYNVRFVVDDDHLIVRDVVPAIRRGHTSPPR